MSIIRFINACASGNISGCLYAIPELVKEFTIAPELNLHPGSTESILSHILLKGLSLCAGHKNADWARIMKHDTLARMTEVHRFELLRVLCRCKNVNMIRALLSLRSDGFINEVWPGEIVNSLGYAVGVENIDLVNALLDGGANPNAHPLRDNGGYTALDAACFGSDVREDEGDEPPEEPPGADVRTTKTHAIIVALCARGAFHSPNADWSEELSSETLTNNVSYLKALTSIVNHDRDSSSDVTTEYKTALKHFKEHLSSEMRAYLNSVINEGKTGNKRVKK